MSTTLITNIGELTTNVEQGGDPCGTLRDAAVLIADGRVAWVGRAADAPSAARVAQAHAGARDSPESGASVRVSTVGAEQMTTVDAAGRAVIPGFVDSHTHLVFGGDRADEFEARMSGTPYAAGGIRRTVAATRAASDDELRARLAGFVAEMAAQGTTTFEVKTGYGLTVADEERAARIAAEVTDEVTFLGAHVVPAEHADDRETYVDLVCGEMLDAVAPHAKWIDVFCERGAFTADESRRVLEAGAARGLGLRVHGNQLGHGEGVTLAVAAGAASVDHCTYLDDADVAALAASDTVATLLPGVEFSTRQPYPDARRLIDAGVTVALASDCNPGSSFTSSMPLMVALAVREMGMTPAEAVWASTAGGARALRRDDVGVIAPGARADLVLLDAPTRVHLAYRPGVPLVHTVWRGGEIL
ncbi:imidazolonepropionase [Microbacterium terrae]|uniref:Imidazolonepropionase n=1 Tax=Microbacterium terrae TaxID=69369 RepID=A0A0M2GZH6_9MICO|nr:imidazolonepropionase [Microbacterium terrae]KJL39283.1 Imidazolonepropionase [Microbacterium terrae]MBP1076784.1 imidazolonepropionase [Microbacterium terrae]GLJ99378.1 imidazolonepropionase [Microbacterium terrae]